METMLFYAFLVMYFANAFSANLGYDGSPYSEEVDDVCGQPPIRPLVNDDKVQSRILGGSEAKAHSWPWQVSIRCFGSDKKPHHICGGTIIAQNKILSAAHCLEQFGMKTQNYQVVVGKHVRTANETEAKLYRVKKISVLRTVNLDEKIYPDDIMVLTLTTNMIYDKNIMPVCLPQSSEPRDKLCYVTGWGKTVSSPFSQKTSDALQQVDIPIRNRTLCQKQYSETEFNRTTMICAGGIVSKDSCQGDSGGPLVCKENGIWYQYGVVSHGIGCGKKNVPGVYTRVYYYRNWLEEKIYDD